MRARGASRPVQLPRSRLDVNIHADRVEVYEHYSQEAAGRLRRRLRELGIRTRVVFRSPCG